MSATSANLPHAGLDLRPTQQNPTVARRAAVAAGVGTLVEYYDFAVYAYLSVTLASLFFPGGNRATSMLITLAAFGTSYLMRPIGGIVIGHLADAVGRRFALFFSIIAMGVASSLIGILPTAVEAGVWASFCLVSLRLIQGFAAGGEIGGAAAIAAELAPPHKRALYSAAPAMGGIGGFAMAAAIVGALNLGVGRESMSDWGWRIPFLLSLPLTAICVWLRSELPAQEAGRDRGARHSAPFMQLFREEKGRLFAALCLSVAGLGTSYFTMVYVSIHMIEVGGFNRSAVYWVSAATTALAVVLMPFFGGIVDRVGFRRMGILSLVAYALLSYPCLLLVSQDALGLAFIGYGLMGVCMASMQVCVFTVLPRLFAQGSRVTGISTAYNVASIISGGSAPFVCSWLVKSTGVRESPALFVLAVALIGIVVLLKVRPTDLYLSRD